MNKHEFTGWVEYIFPANDYDREIAIANYEGGLEGQKTALAAYSDRRSKVYPTTIRVKASIKSGAASQIDDLNVGDKVTVRYAISGKSGISKKSGEYYCFSTLNLLKQDGVSVLERAKANAPADAPAGDDEEFPF